MSIIKTQRAKLPNVLLRFAISPRTVTLKKSCLVSFFGGGRGFFLAVRPVRGTPTAMMLGIIMPMKRANVPAKSAAARITGSIV